MKFRALLFDLDGTLVDSHHEICLALDLALRDAGHVLEDANVRALVDGAPLETIWEKLHVDRTLPPSEHYGRFVHAYRAHYMRDLGHATSLFPGVRETLVRLREGTPHTRLAVVSNKGAPTVGPLLEKMAIAEFFALALGAGGTALRAKPAPDLLVHAMEQLSCAPSECAMIGDTIMDVEAGRRAGVTTIALTHGMGARAALLAAEPDYVIDSFDELSALLGS